MFVTWLLWGGFVTTGCLISEPSKVGGPIDPTEPGTDTGVVEAIDADRDGFPRSVDCDDADPLVYPGAVDACDGVDNDCSTVVDDGDGVASITRADGSTLFPTVDEAIAAGVQFAVQVDLCAGPATVTPIVLNGGDKLTIASVHGRDDTVLTADKGQTFASLSGEAQLSLNNVTVTGSVQRALVLDDTASLTLYDAAVSSNPGGALLVADRAEGVTVLVSGSSLDDNVVPDGIGGAIRAEGRAFDITIQSSDKFDSRLASNEAEQGGAIALINRPGARLPDRKVTILADTAIEGNTAALSGGAIYSVLGTITLEGVTMDGNATAGMGGALDLVNSVVTAASTSLSGNQAGIGGAVSLDVFGFSLFSATNDVSIVDNVATETGGGLSGSGFVSNVFVARNEAPLGGGLYVPAGTFITLEEATFDQNTGLQGGGIFLDADTDVELIDVGLSLNEAVTERYSSTTTTVPLPLPDNVEVEFVGLGGAVFMTDGSVLEARSSDFGIDESDIGGVDNDNRPGDIFVRALGSDSNHEQLALDMDVVCDDGGCLLVQTP